MKLHEQFTTRAQSIELLQLGIPVDTADCCVDKDGHVSVLEGKYLDYCKYIIDLDSDIFPYPSLPCWSTGRIIEIIEICHTSEIKPGVITFDASQGVDIAAFIELLLIAI